MAQDEHATTEMESEEGAAGTEAYKLSLTATVEKSGPCKRHVRVTVPRADIEHFREEEVGDLSESATVPGFRVGRVPKALVEKRFRKELSAQVKQKILLQSLEQVAEEYKLDPINEPDLDVETIDLPEEGDFEYEFDVEVRPEFDLPDYQGLTIERPVQEVTDAQIDQYLQRFLSQYGRLDTRDEPAETDDFVTVSIEFRHNGEVLNKLEEVSLQLRPVLRFQDAELADFDKLMAGAKAGETREAEVVVSQEAESIELRGEKVQAQFQIADVRRLVMPELDKEFLGRIGVESEAELREEVRQMLERQAKFQQRQSVRAQVLEKITESADWDLPEGTVRRQVENALRREILEMQQAGFTTQEIRARENELRQKAVTNTRQALKEHFVLDKIATEQNIEVLPHDIDGEIRLMAIQRGESPRRVRARLVKSGVIENLEAQIRERKAIDYLLETAQYVDKKVEAAAAEDRVEAVPFAVCGTTGEAVSVTDEEEAGEAE